MACRLALILVIVAACACEVSGALPDESHLPGEHVEQAKPLPAESELPRSSEPAPAVDVELPPLEDEPPPEVVDVPSTETDPPPADLPGEGALPPEIDGAAPEPAGSLPLAGSPDGIPWLRLNLRGHTAPIRAVEFTHDGNRLCTAGDDKSVVVWLRDPASGEWQYERTVRWQIQRATRGRIYALASSPGLLAIGGEGAMGGIGEIVLVDPATGDFVTSLFDEDEGNLQVIVALNFVETPDGPALASQSIDGKAVLWTKNEQGLWRPKVAVPDDRTAGVAAELQQRLRAGRPFSGIVALDRQRVIVPVYDSIEQGQVFWRLEVVDTASGARTPLGGANAPRLLNIVPELVADAGRTKLVAADVRGRVYLWNLKTQPVSVTPFSRSQKSEVHSLALSADGRTLVIGTSIDPSRQKYGVEVWDLSNPQAPRRKTSYDLRAPVLACAVDGQLGEIAYSSQASVIVRSPAANSPARIVRSATEMPLRVAFAKDEPFYRIGIGTKRNERGQIPINRTFDTDQLRLSRSDIPDEQSWLPTDWGSGGWRVIETTARRQPIRTWSFAEGDARRAQLPLNEATTGVFRCVCWIPGEVPSKPTMAAIGTSAGGILIVELKPDGTAPILRRFRGHTSDVTSLAVSRDLRWLVSASNDATVCVWPLGSVLQEPATINRWGATFAIGDDGRLTIETIRADGPLYFRGAREGDEIIACQYYQSGENRELTDPQELLAFLAGDWEQLVRFELRTGRQATRRFQILPAWQQMVSLVMDQDGEWAYWTPSGYYDASFEGHRLFGWQINRGLEELPDFFLAAQFRGVLERPAVMSRLLRAGNVEAAFRAAKVESPADSAQTIANTYRLKPEVTIFAPGNDLLTKEAASRKLQAQIRVPAGQALVRVKAFANGVVAPPGRLIDRKLDGTSELLLYEWELAVPSDPRVLVQVTAATDNEIAATDQMVLENAPSPSGRKPRMFFLAAGIDDYRDAQIPKLRTPVAHVKTLTDLLRSQSRGLYQVEASSMLDERATRSAWQFLTKHNADRLREEASPDDLLVIYLSGHGVQDVAGDQFQFVTADADFGEVMSGSYADCLSSADFSQFVDISCRKLVILDTCHGGAIQPLRHREMKLAVRALQQDLLMTLAASDGAEEAVEGRFSTRLIEGLEGAADRDDGNGDGVVRLDELVAYIKRNVGADSLRDTVIQTPSAGPIDLLPFVTPPLSEVAQSKRVGQLKLKNR